MNLVSGNIRFMGIFAGVPLGGGVKWQWGCRRRQFFGDLCGYLFGNVRDKSSSITWRYATSWLPVIDCKMNDLEWPWVPISRQNPFSTNKAVALTFALARLSCMACWKIGENSRRYRPYTQKQESWAIAKMTARCALWVHWKFPRVPDYAHGYFSGNF